MVRTRHFSARIVAGVVLAIAAYHTALADGPRALPQGAFPDDHRTGPLRTFDDYFPFTPVASKGAWEKRAEVLRRQVQVATGLWPMPKPEDRPPLNAKVFGKVERDDYTVEKVIFESYPGHYVTGNLYRPKGKAGKRPAVLNPHGHWRNGRFHAWTEAEVRKLIDAGAERFEKGGRYPLQARLVQQARMGCVAFMYDMEGYADSVQFTDAAGLPAHRPGVREAMNTADNWGLSGPQADLRFQTTMGLQTWNSIRAVDFIASLPDVDPTKIAVTGASGGGTQSFILSAIDARVAACLPAVMVSTAMQGGCPCENAPYLRIGAGNIDLAALTAPRPLCMVGADDWTRELLTKGYPDLQSLYAMLGVTGHVHAEVFPQFAHNYNAVSRGVMHAFLDKHFQLGHANPAVERDFEPLSQQEMSVWDSGHPKPAGDQVGPAHERGLVREIEKVALKRMPSPQDGEAFRRVVGGAWDVILGRRLEDVGEVTFELKAKTDRGSHLEMTGLVTHVPAREQLPVLFLHPKENWNGQIVIWIDGNGKSGLLAPDGAPVPAVAKLLEAKFSVLSADLLGQGEFTADGKPVATQRVQFYGDGSQPWMMSAIYTFGYNRPLFCQRVQDVLTLIRFVQTDEHKAKSIHLLGLGKTAGPIAAAVRGQAGNAVNKAAIDPAGFRFTSSGKFDDPMFVPGAAKYGDVPGLLALGSGKLWVAVEPSKSERRPNGDETPVQTDAAVEWLIQP